MSAPTTTTAPVCATQPSLNCVQPDWAPFECVCCGRPPWTAYFCHRCQASTCETCVKEGYATADYCARHSLPLAPSRPAPSSAPAAPLRPCLPAEDYEYCEDEPGPPPLRAPPLVVGRALRY